MSGQDEAKTFLQGFLDQLAQSEQTNRDLLQVQRIQVQQTQQILQQNQQVLAALSTVSAQLDGIAQRSDYLYDQMGRLGQAMINEGEPPHGELAPVQFENVTRNAARGVVDGLINEIFPGHGGGGRRRRR